jgi:hypothetical protein
MARPGFCNDNEGRAYPLIPFSNALSDKPAEFRLPLDTLLDFGCLVGLDSEFDDTKDVIYLHQVTRAGNTFTFDFRSSAPGLVGYALKFSRDLTDAEFATNYVAAVALGSSPPPQPPLWEGFLVTGPMDNLAALMPADGTLAATTGPQIEPARIQNLSRSYVRTINLANQDRTHVTPPDDCPGGSLPASPLEYIINARNLVGDLRFKEGFNVSIRQNTRTNSITFMAVLAGGAGVVCGEDAPLGELPLTPDEQPPPGSSLLSGGPACDEVIYGINGLTASVILLVADVGTTITSSDDNTSLIVDFDRHDMTVCAAASTIIEDLGDAVEVIVEDLGDA